MKKKAKISNGMKNFLNKKGFAYAKIIIPITVLILSGIIGGGVYYYQKVLKDEDGSKNNDIKDGEDNGLNNSSIIPQQPADADFTYSLWLGRGLYTNEELDRAFEMARSLGVKNFEVEFKWSYVEPQNDQWQWNNEETLDVEHVIELAKKYDMAIAPYYDVFMPWAEVKKDAECDGMQNARGLYEAPDAEEYAEYAFAVIDKLKSNGVDVNFVNLDNEPSENNDGYTAYGCFINVTAKQLKEAENMAYEKIKAKYSDISISSTNFAFPGLSTGGVVNSEEAEKDKKRRNGFIKAYLGDEPKPKFDYFAVHEVLSGSGNPYTTLENPVGSDYEYNFGSYNDAYGMFREILDKYGYDETPIFNTESAAVLTGKQDAQLVQRFIFARANAEKNNVIGVITSQLTGSAAFSELGARGKAQVGITRLTDGYELRDGYYGYYSMMATLPNYPNYEGKFFGELNSQKPWAEKFSDDDGNILYAVFIPYLGGKEGDQEAEKQEVYFSVGEGKKVGIIKSDGTVSTMEGGSDGKIRFSVGEHPVFVEIEIDREDSSYNFLKNNPPRESEDAADEGDDDNQASSPGGNKPSGNGKCGDGVCDDIEKKMGVCSDDCGGSSTPGQQPQGGDNPAGSGKCGDGTCDSLEKEKGVCSEDCGGSSGGSAPGGGINTDKCGDGVCDDTEKEKGVCPEDCN